MHSQGGDQAFTFNGSFGPGNHTVAVNFLNDAWGPNAPDASGSVDRNLYIDAITYRGTNTNQTAEMMSGGVQSFSISGGTSAPAPAPAAILITPGNGTFSDSAGNVYTLTSGNVAMENNAAIPGGAGTSEMEYYNQKVYGQDAKSGNWYTWNQSTWSAAAAPPAVSSTPTPPPTPAPTVTTVGSGSDTIVLQMSEDPDGPAGATGRDAAFTVNVDGQQIGGLLTTTALHSSGSTQTFKIIGNFAVGQHRITVTFANNPMTPGDKAAFNDGGDRNLYVNSVTYDGISVSATKIPVYTSPGVPPDITPVDPGDAVFTVNDTTAVPANAPSTPSTSPASISVGAGADKIILMMAEDPWQGDAQFTVSVDGKQIGGTFTTTAVAWEGQSQEFDLLGNWGGGGHTVAVNYLNDAAALNAAGQGIDSQDRNLFVESLSYDGAAGQGAPWELASNGTQTFKVLGASSTPVTTSGNSFITPGNGSFSDTAGNVYTLTSNDVAMENNAAIPGGAGTGKMEYYSQQVYGQDAKSGNWYIWNQSYWTGATAPAAVTVPTPVTTGSGSDSIVLQISEDTFANGDGTSDAQGDATFTVSIDGKQQGGVFTSSALHGHGQEQAFTFNGTFGGGSHTVTVNFLNDAWNANAPAGNGSVDRNLYVDQVSYDGMNTNQSSALMSSGTQNFTVGTVMPTSPGTSSAQPGQWTISSVNGMQYMVLLPDDYSSSIKYATTLYLHQLDNGSYGPQNLQNQINAWFNTASFRSSYPSIIVAPLLDQTIDPSGNTINFGGVSTSDTTGENNAIAALQQVLSQYSTDPSRVYVTGNSMGGIGSDDMIIKYNAYTGTEGKIFAAALSLAGADYGQGYPQPNQSVVQGLKGVPVWAIHGGQDTQVPLAWDQNLYAAEQSIGGVMKYTQDDGLGHDVWDTYYAQTGAASPLDWLYSQHLPSISLTTASGQSQIITAAVAGTKAFNGDTFSITAPGAAKATLGSAAETLRFISMKSVALNEGSGNVTVTSDGGTNSWTAGVGQLEVRGGSGTDSYLYHANAGRLTVDDFATAKGDTLTVDAALKGSLKVASDGHGGTMLSFGSGGGIDLKGFTGTATNLIHWT